MRRLGLMAALALALALAAWAQPAAADEFESYQEANLRDCVANNPSEDVVRRCIGAGANPCIARDGASTSSYVLCWSHEADSWRGLIERATNDVNQRNPARDPQRLAAANAAWDAWAEAECEYWSWEQGGGSGEQVDRVQCLAQITADRAISLLVAGDSP